MTNDEKTTTASKPTPASVQPRHDMRRFMIAIETRPEVTRDELTPHLAGEREAYAQLVREGAIERGELALGRRRGWLTVRAADEAGARSTLARLPLARFWSAEVVELEPPF